MKITPSPIVNPKDVRQLVSKHKLFARIQEQYGNPPNWSRPQGFISLSKIILEQQVSLASANAHFINLNQFIKEFKPENILKLSDTEMRACQVSRQKATYLRELSKAVMQGRIIFEVLPELNPAEIREKLTAVKGIGNWTTEVYLIFCLQSKDIFPMGDIALINTIRELTTSKSKEQIEKLVEKWAPQRSLAAFFLWHYYLKKRNREYIQE